MALSIYTGAHLVKRNLFKTLADPQSGWHEDSEKTHSANILLCGSSQPEFVKIATYGVFSMG
jgi:hypothetical protein